MAWHLLAVRRFMPLFVTQFLGALNDNLFKNAMVLLLLWGEPNVKRKGAMTTQHMLAAVRRAQLHVDHWAPCPGP